MHNPDVPVDQPRPPESQPEVPQPRVMLRIDETSLRDLRTRITRAVRDGQPHIDITPLVTTRTLQRRRG